VRRLLGCLATWSPVRTEWVAPREGEKGLIGIQKVLGSNLSIEKTTNHSNFNYFFIGANVKKNCSDFIEIASKKRLFSIPLAEESIFFLRGLTEGTVTAMVLSSEI
jgi:hypothetical protein